MENAGNLSGFAATANIIIDEKAAVMRCVKSYLDSISDHELAKECLMDMVEYVLCNGNKGVKKWFFTETDRDIFVKIEREIMSNPIGSKKSKIAVENAAKEIERICGYLIYPSKANKRDSAQYRDGIGEDVKFTVWVCAHALLIPGLIRDFDQIRLLTNFENVCAAGLMWNEYLDQMDDLPQSINSIFRYKMNFLSVIQPMVQPLIFQLFDTLENLANSLQEKVPIVVSKDGFLRENK